MSLDTLLEAAKFIEMEEEKKRKATTQPPPPPPPQTRIMPTPMPPTLPLTPPPPPLHQQQQQQQHQPPPPAALAIQQNSSVSAPAQLQLIAAATVEQQQHQLQQVTSSTMEVGGGGGGVQPIHVQPVIIHNSFDILNTVLLDESGKPNRKPPPMAFRSGMREVHNKLEKHRRAHLKECFDELKKQLPVTQEVKKTSNLNILHSAIDTIQLLQRKEREHEDEMERLAKEKIALQQKLANLKKDYSLHDVEFTSHLQDAELPNTIHLNEIEMVTEAKHITNDVHQITKSITLPVNAAAVSSTALPLLNGTRDSHPAHVQTTALSVVPLSYKMNQSVVVQKVFVPKSVMVSANQPMTHFIPMSQPLGGKVMPLVNAQYVVKPMVVVTTPSRPS
ncbi:PREDICTED: max-binding protein MNT-like [Nicrophorus vespilloides]|uniref:Max-binding protein MNT-like n=1 Tax=Nicrophorus vespilloides TaxID=110193 RepID=A0ABM1N1B9_NICVS|nr:PREDICTED: max-binding protein MNT-like [Nicrophorus vespilloides]XP_017780619.1 PREDICTED: max-binding protein MNT-like [Nicrophorus vespilloides]